ncbi:hypothetical protein [Faecalimicrobium dakarense]|uniref:hypothetical protein n=1 Tax=Faecalimicrobium dakarense TaxID=1301100 RepID=UPI0005A70F6E|nr:hypothetical protein [[Clostridium] dakarense]
MNEKKYYLPFLIGLREELKNSLGIYMKRYLKNHQVDILLFNEDNSNIKNLNEKFYIKNEIFKKII